MAGSLNKVILVGHLGQDPKISYAQSGMPIANLRVATSERIRDKTGQWNERTEWHNVVCFDKQAEFCGNYMAKGGLVLVEGRLQTRKWQDREGQDRYTTEIVANRVQALGPRQQGADAGQRQSSQQVMRENYQRQQQEGYRQQPQAAPRGGGEQPPEQKKEEEDLGPAFPSEASGMDDVPF